MRMLVATRAAPMRSAAAQTGAPAKASAAFTPSARSSVLLPDMFEPVTTSARPATGSRTSLPTRRSPGESG